MRNVGTKAGKRLDYERTMPYNLMEFERSVGHFEKKEKRPAYKSLTEARAIMQAIYYNEWPDVTK